MFLILLCILSLALSFLNSRSYHGKIKSRVGKEVLDTLKRIEEEIVPNLTTPFLVAHGTHDKITNIQGSLFLYNNATKCQDKKIIKYEGFFHELLNEPKEDAERVLKDILAWFESHL
jgi:acylglycerol lipase